MGPRMVSFSLVVLSSYDISYGEELDEELKWQIFGRSNKRKRNKDTPVSKTKKNKKLLGMIRGFRHIENKFHQ